MSTEPENRAKARRYASAVTAQLERDIVQDEALRSLLSYCRTSIEHAHGGAWDAYSDVADKLAAILDGEQ